MPRSGAGLGELSGCAVIKQGSPDRWCNSEKEYDKNSHNSCRPQGNLLVPVDRSGTDEGPENNSAYCFRLDHDMEAGGPQDQYAVSQQRRQKECRQECNGYVRPTPCRRRRVRYARLGCLVRILAHKQTGASIRPTREAGPAGMNCQAVAPRATSPCPPTGVVSNRSPKPAMSGLPRAMASWTEGSDREA